MKNKGKWIASKFIYKKGRLIGSRDPRELGIDSRLIGDIVASLYDKYLPRYATGQLLDLGCGKVPLFEAYRNYITDNICVDWDNTMHENEYLDCRCNIGQRLPFNNHEFNTIILSDVLEHIAQPEILWQEMSRMLISTGKVIMNTPFYYWVHEVPHDYYRYTEHALRRFATLAGFKILHLIPVGGTPEILTDIIAKHLLIIPLLGNILAMACQYTMSILLKIKAVKNISDKTSTKFPLGYFLVAEKVSE